jgi:hypothetical protein
MRPAGSAGKRRAIDTPIGLGKKKAVQPGEVAAPPKVVAQYVARLSGRKQDTAEAAPNSYLGAKY